MFNTSLSSSPPQHNREVLEELATYYRQLWKHHQRAALLAKKKLSSTKTLLDSSNSQNEEAQPDSPSFRYSCCNREFYPQASSPQNFTNGNLFVCSQCESLAAISRTSRNGGSAPIPEINGVKEDASSDRRKHIRFQQQTGTIVRIDFKIDEFDFVYSEWGQIVDDSFGGCGLALVTRRAIELNQTCHIKLEDLEPLKARIVWKKELAENIFRVGIEYIN